MTTQLFDVYEVRSLYEGNEEASERVRCNFPIHTTENIGRSYESVLLVSLFTTKVNKQI